jgi:hypothetical protein
VYSCLMTAGNFYCVMALGFYFWRSFFSFPPGILFLCISDNNNNCRSSSQRKTGFLWFPIRSRSYWDAHSLAAPSTIVWCSCLHEQEREAVDPCLCLSLASQNEQWRRSRQSLNKIIEKKRTRTNQNKKSQGYLDVTIFEKCLRTSGFLQSS